MPETVGFMAVLLVMLLVAIHFDKPWRRRREKRPKPVRQWWDQR